MLVITGISECNKISFVFYPLDEMSVFLILIGLARNSQCKLQSPQAALVCVQSPNSDSLRSLLWLTDKQHDEGHWRKTARIEEGAESLSTMRWASPKPSQLSNCRFLACKSLLSSPSACLLFYVLLVTNQWNQNCLSWNAPALLKRSSTLCLLWGKRLRFGAFTRSLGIN